MRSTAFEHGLNENFCREHRRAGNIYIGLQRRKNAHSLSRRYKRLQHASPALKARKLRN